jgi:hypothetical protein
MELLAVKIRYRMLRCIRRHAVLTAWVGYYLVADPFDRIDELGASLES